MMEAIFFNSWFSGVKMALNGHGLRVKSSKNGYKDDMLIFILSRWTFYLSIKIFKKWVKTENEVQKLGI